jgi:hypothetical protein
MKETPHGWVILKIKSKNEPPIYKVFASWRGGYLDGNSWKINSGIKSVEETNTHFVFHGYSGSEYHCDKKYYGHCTGYAGGVLSVMIERASKYECLIEELPHDYNFKTIGNGK